MLLEYINKNTASVLDVGCGKGAFVLAASRFLKAKGIDVSIGAVQYGRAAGLDLVNGNFLEHDFGTERFDAVTLWDVLACLPDQRLVFKKVFQLLKSGGVFVFTAPVTDSFSYKILNERWPFLIPPVNISYHTKKSIQTLADQTGYKTVKYEKTGKRIDLSFLLLKLSKMLKFKRTDKLVSCKPFSIYINTYDIATVVLYKK